MRWRMLGSTGYAVIWPATRVANTISSISLLLIALVVLSSVGIAVSAGGGAALVVLIYAAMVSLLIYVTSGWLEQLLRLLIGIAYNTAEGAGLMPGELGEQPRDAE